MNKTSQEKNINPEEIICKYRKNVSRPSCCSGFEMRTMVAISDTANIAQ